MALVDHVGDIRFASAFPLVVKNLVKNSEYLVRINRAKREVVIGIAAVVEVKSSQHVLREQPRDNLLNVLRLIMMSRIHEHFGLRSSLLRKVHGHPPVGDVGMVKRRLKWLVLH